MLNLFRTLGYPELLPLPAGASRPFWSVVVPVYNRTTYLRECIESVLDQCHAAESMEVLVVDSGSAKPIGVNVARIGRSIVQYWRFDDNLGHVCNWNRAVSLARGHWIHLLHDDDYVLPGFYERLQRGVVEGGPTVGAACTAYDNVNDAGEVSFSQRLDAPRGVLDFVGWMRLLGIGNCLNPPAVVIRREAYETVGLYHPAYEWMPDWELYKRVAACIHWWHEPELLAHYRRHPQSGTSLTRMDHKWRTILPSIEASKHYFPAEVWAEVSAKSRQQYFELALVDSVFQSREGNKDVAGAILREAQRFLCP